MTKVGSRAFSLASQAGGHPSPNLQPPAKPPRGRSPPFLLPRYWQLESKRQCKPEIADRHNRAFHNQIRESPALSFLNPYQPHSLTSIIFWSTFAELLLCALRSMSPGIVESSFTLRAAMNPSQWQSGVGMRRYQAAWCKSLLFFISHPFFRNPRLIFSVAVPAELRVEDHAAELPTQHAC